MKKNQHLFLLIFLSLFLLLGMQVSVSAAMQSGDYNYTVSITGKYPDQKSTIYRQKNGTYTKQKLITVSGCATPKLVYKNVLYYEKDHIYDSELIDLWTYNLKTKKIKCVQKNAAILRQNGKNLLLAPNTGAVSPLPCYLYNLSTGKSKRIDSSSINSDMIDGKIYYAKCLSKKWTNKGYPTKIYSYSLKTGKRKAISKTFYASYCRDFTSQSVIYRSLGNNYKYTYATGKSTRIF